MADPHLSEPDSFTLHLEQDPLLRSTIVAVAVLDRVPDWGRLTEAIDRATRLEPNFRRRLIPGANALLPARWVDDPAFDLSWHLRRVAVPSPGTLAEVLELARVAGTTAFDPIRPRWEFTVVEGLPDGAAALVMKVHHALTDGIGGIQLAQHVVDLDRKGTKRLPVPPPPPGPSDGSVARVADAARYRLGRSVELANGVARQVPDVVRAVTRRPMRVPEEVGRAARSVARFVRPITSTLSPVMQERLPGWRYQELRVPLAGLKGAAALAGGTLNDAFLAGVGGGFGRYHRLHGATVPSLRITMPISIRREDDPAGGNRITLVRFEIPVDEQNPVSRMLAVHATTSEWRQEPAVEWTGGIAAALNLLPTSVSAGMLKHVDLVTSNVPGFDRWVYVGGARLERFLAFGPTLGAAANVVLMSYRDHCDIGVTTDVGAVPDHEALLGCLQESFDELVQLAASTPAQRPGGRSGRASDRG